MLWRERRERVSMQPICLWSFVCCQMAWSAFHGGVAPSLWPTFLHGYPTLVHAGPACPEMGSAGERQLRRKQAVLAKSVRNPARKAPNSAARSLAKSFRCWFVSWRVSLSNIGAEGNAVRARRRICCAGWLIRNALTFWDDARVISERRARLKISFTSRMSMVWDIQSCGENRPVDRSSSLQAVRPPAIRRG